MRVAIAGSGAMGCRFGVMFYEAENDVLLVDHWDDHVNAINEKGIEVVTEEGSRRFKIPAVLPANSTGTVDLLLISTKAMQTAEMINACQHLIGDHTIVLTLQNGLGNIEILEQYVSRDRLYAGVTLFGTELLSPGKIQAFGTGHVELMQVDGHKTDATMRLVDKMNGAGMNVIVSEDVIKTIWSKVGFNSVLNTICTLMESNVGQVGTYRDIHIIVEGIVSEIVAVGQAEGIELEQAHIVAMVNKVFDLQVSGNHYPSMVQDMENNRRTEIDYLNGAIVQRGDKHGIAVPINRLMTHLIRMKELMRQFKIAQ